MDLNKTIEEIGVLETNIQIEKYLYNKKLMQDISKYIPIPSYSSTSTIIDNVILNLKKLKKENILMLSNEIALIEQMSKYSDCFKNVIVVLSRNLTSSQIVNIEKNTPRNININFIRELDFPKLIKPKNSVILSFGYLSGNKCIISNNSYRMLEIYNDFLGEKIFVSCINEEINNRPKNWISINSDNYFTKII